eukprot:1336223-Rhodomonas_salina.2
MSCPLGGTCRCDRKRVGGREEEGGRDGGREGGGRGRGREGGRDCTGTSPRECTMRTYWKHTLHQYRASRNRGKGPYHQTAKEGCIHCITPR